MEVILLSILYKLFYFVFRYFDLFFIDEEMEMEI